MRLLDIDPKWPIRLILRHTTAFLTYDLHSHLRRGFLLAPPSIYTEIGAVEREASAGSLTTSGVAAVRFDSRRSETPRRSSSKSAKTRVFNKSFGLAGFCPKRRSTTESKLFSPKACVDTERLKSRSKEL